MVMRHRVASFVAAVFISFLLGFLLTAPPARAAETAESFVTANVEKGTAILNDTTLSDGERQERFRTFVLSLTDVKRVAIFTLGPYARGESGSQLDDYVHAFTDYLAAVYERGLAKYSGQTIRVTGSVARSDNDNVVNAEIIGKDTNYPPLRIAFRVRKSEAGFVVTDLQIEGVWLALNQRADFAAYLQRHSGDIGTLSQELKLRAGQIRLGAGTSPAA
jgi:phospholipid transport system substrate-binding protein